MFLAANFSFWSLAESSSTTIRNFGKVNDNLYRGAQPALDELRNLREMGIRTVVDLREGDRSGETTTVRTLGMNYVSIPMNDSQQTYDPEVTKFLSLMKDSTKGPFFVHCAGGRHRTGTVVASYRMSVDGWGVDRAYREMKDYGFYTAWGHGGYKTYVYDYYDRLHHQAQNVPVAERAVAAGAARN